MIDETFNFGVALKTLPTKGNLVYEYNPFYNYRLNHTMIYYKKQLMEIEDFCKHLGITEEEFEDKSKSNNWESIIPANEEIPVVYQAGQLVDFETSELNFDLQHPVNILPQWSYDNSVNLIINDGENPPRLINSRFSATQKNKYQVCNRKGNNDSNIYDQGEQFDIDTSLYKKINGIPELKFLGVSYGGNLSIGNYHFYFRYVDEDGNESDFFAESGLVSIFIGNSADSIHSGFRDEQAHKQIKFALFNTDPGYQKVIIYYTKSSSDIFENATIQARKILREYQLSNGLNTVITISGFEETQEVTLDDINVQYQIYGSAKTQATVQNMLFLGNVDKPKTDYEDLTDCALRFLPVLDCTENYNINQIGLDYTGNITNTYYDPNYIYHKVGYWDDEIYRLGIVFIRADNTLTEVFNVRGASITKDTQYSSYSDIPFYQDESEKIRNFINFDEQYYNIFGEGTSQIQLENAKGVIHIDHPDFSTVIGLNFKVDKKVLTYLRETKKIKGYFFVRQKRIPTTLCQAYTIGIDKESHTPVLPVNVDEKLQYITESFLSQDENDKKILTHDLYRRKYILEPQQVSVQGAICPEYDVNSSYLNTLFSASELVCRNCKDQNLLKQDDIHFYPDFRSQKTNSYTKIKVIGVEDNVKLVAINDNMFSARAGEAEEAFRFEYIGKKNVHEDVTNLLRGCYGPYLGITGYENAGHLIDIKIPDYNPSSLSEYFEIRYHDKSSFYAISSRYDLNRIDEWAQQITIGEKKDYYQHLNPIYRGDCYICQFTHRLNRNFQDPSAPTNDEIVDPNCWEENFKVTDGVVNKENFEKINLGDVNAIRLGMYITLVVRSTMNLNIRALDSSVSDEEAMFGHSRGFYPYSPMTTKGSYKIPEALCYNKGFEKSLSEKYNFEVSDVPWIKNEFSNRVSYSNIQVQDAFQNGWRTFIGTHYRDYPKTYGSITKLIELHGNLLCVFEHGVGLIPVNERAVAGEGSGGNVYINTSNVLPENPKIISDTFGSQWRDSIIKTSRGVYGVDTIGKKIWRTNGETFECISDFRVQEFLNHNISLTERELEPVIGVRNVKTHYNKFKGDVMFTFYDNLHGFEERVWNLCWNENLQKWMTFYSWVPSYSENIYNQYFSFDRNTSKWITKLGVSKYGNDFSDGVTLENNVIEDTSWTTKLHLSNRNLPKGDGVVCDVEYEIVRDNYGNYKLFNQPIPTDEIDEETGLRIWKISLKSGVTYKQLCSEYYARVYNNCFLDDLSVDADGHEVTTAPLISSPNTRVNLPKGQRTIWEETLGTLKIYKNDRNRRVNLVSKDKDKRVNGDKVVIFLNIRAKLKVSYEGDHNVELGEAYANGYTDRTFVDAGYYQSVVAVIPKYNMQFLTTDFWKHGQAGIIDIADKIYPTYWYGKQHPFEFEFVVADSPDRHKIFDSLEIISNKAAPESFHYEIVGECYDFAKDKKNMYIRQEATKELYQFNGSDIVFNQDYKDLISEHRPLTPGDPDPQHYDKSTIFPLYYCRQDTINEIEDFYHLYGHKDKYGKGDKNFSALAGAEIVRYENLDEYRIWNHAKAVDIKENGLLRGNMYYKEDKWDVQINPINLVQRNESKEEWLGPYGTTAQMVPAEYNLFPIPEDIKQQGLKKGITLPDDWTRNVISWPDYQKRNQEAKIKDKFIKIRIRYSGEDLAIISAIRTLYSISYA